MFSPPSIGEAAELHHVVTDQDTALAFENEGVRSLASPRVQHWIEKTASALWASHRDGDEVLLGVTFELHHLASSPVGSNVTTRLVVTAVNKRRTTYQIEAWDDAGPICEGTYETYIMPMERYLARLQERRDERKA